MTKTFGFTNMRYLLLITIIFLGLLYAVDMQAGIIIRPVFHTGLVGYWDFQEGAGDTTYDKSGYDNDGDLTNMEENDWVDGKIGKALDFDGDNDYVVTPYYPNATNPITLSYWVKWDSVSGERQNTGVHDRANHRAYAGIDEDGECMWGFGNNYKGASSPSGEVACGMTTGIWYLITTTGDGSNGTYYINGVITDTMTYSQSAVSNLPFHIGSQNDQNNGPGFNETDGVVDEVRIYNRALSAGEVMRLYKLSQPKIVAPTREGLVGYWPFEEGTGTKAGDHSNNSNNGTLTSMEEADWVDGKLGGALDFDGSNDRVIVAHQDYFQQAPFTVAAWFKVNQLPSTRAEEGTIVVKRGIVWRIWLDKGPDSIYFTVKDSGSAGHLISYDPSPLVIDTWYHVVGTLESDYDMKLYVNGAEKDSGNSGSLDSSTGDIWIGASFDDAERLDGVIDEVRIYDRALEASEIEALYKSGRVKFNASQNDKLTDGLVGLWSFNGPDMAGDEAWDRSGEGNHGILQNGPVRTIGKVGQALEFDGSTNYVDCGDEDAFNPGTGTVTWTAWFKSSATGISHYIMNFIGGTGYTGNGHLALEINASNVLHTNAQKKVGETYYDADEYSSSTVNDGEWHHGALIWNYSTKTLELFLDGASEGTNTNTNITEPPVAQDGRKFSIGVQHYNTGDQNYFNGKIDEVRVYNRALTAKEIQRLYNLGH